MARRPISEFQQPRQLGDETSKPIPLRGLGQQPRPVARNFQPVSITRSGPRMEDPEFKGEQQAFAQEQKEAAKSARVRRKAKGQLEQTLLRFGRVAQKTKDLTGLRPGRVAGFVNEFVLGPTGLNPQIADFKGDLVETATSIAKIAAPSAKVGPDLIKLFSGTLPNVFSNFAEAKNQTVSSLTNGLIDFAANNPDQFPEGLNAKVFRDEMEKVVDALIAKEDEVFADLEKKDIKKSIGKKTVGRFQIEEV